MKKKRIWVRVAAGIVISLVCVMGGGVFFLSRGLSAGQAMVISPLALDSVDDGEYVGSYVGGRWSCEVLVEVKNHQIVKITSLRDVVFPMEGLQDNVFQQVLLRQDTAIDVKSQATVTSKAYLKAIEHALQAEEHQ